MIFENNEYSKRIMITLPDRVLFYKSFQMNFLEEDLHGRTHGTLDVDNSDVLPLLLQQRSQEIRCQLYVNNVLLLGELGVSNSNVQAHNLLHLELDGRLDLVDLLLHIIRTGEKSGELSCLGKTGSQKTRNLLNHVIRGKEEIVLLCKLLNKLLVLVKLLQVLNTHVVDSDTVCLLTMSSVSEHAALEVRAGNGGELESSRETLLTLRIVVLKGNLHLDGLGEVTLLSLNLLSTLGDGFTIRVSEDISETLV
jgi:hypothetical protein